jgi:hypothetical protein
MRHCNGGELISAGFQTRLLAGCGDAVRFRRHAGILAVKPSKGTS